MAPAANNVSLKANRSLEGKSYQVVAWDLDTTGRRLIDEICQIGGFYVLSSPPKDKNETNNKEGDSNGCMQTFSQYVMPYKNPNPGARRSFGIKVVSVGRYRMLKDLDTGKILKTKSEVSALQDFLDWLKEAKSLSGKDGILLACHEPNRKVLVPLLLEALYKYNLLDQFNETVSFSPLYNYILDLSSFQFNGRHISRKSFIMYFVGLWIRKWRFGSRKTWW